jgi:hypothetical protein
MLSIKDSDKLSMQLKEKLQQLPLNHLAIKYSFMKREPQKISPVHFILGFFIMVLTGASSLSSFATSIGLMGGFTLSKQAVAKRITENLVNFLKALLAYSLSYTVQFKSEPIYQNLSSKFNRILLHDSTSIQVDSKLVEHFPGCKNQSQKPIAILKIQAIYDLLSETFCKFNLSSFTRNDQKASSDIIDILIPRDLVIRDLGYFDLSNFKTIHSKSAYFISRLKFGTVIFKSDSKTRLNLLDELTRHRELDIDIVLGVDEKLHVRLIAIPVSESVASMRRRKAKRDCRANSSKERLELLGWNIFMTNVRRSILSDKEILKLYNCRWRIEILFKSWKSHFNITNVPNASATRVESFIYANLIFITLFQTYVFAELYERILKENGNQLSLLKVSRFFKNQIWAIILYAQHFHIIQEQIFYHCQYESRCQRTNHTQMVMDLG